MKNFLIGTIIAAALLAFALSGTEISAQTSLADRYRGGRIAFRVDEDWTSNLPSDQVFERRGDIAVASDGSVFVSNTTRHTVFKFDASGNFVKVIGRPGQGPGDLTNPGRLSILDDKYLIVGELATSRRVSVFDLDGTFVKVVATGRYTSKPVALGNGKIAFVSVGGRMGQDEMINVEEVFVLDWRSGAQKPIAKHEIRTPMRRMPSGNLEMAQPGGVVIAPAGDVGLVVGTTLSSRLDVFSPDGTRVRTIDTGWKAIPVTSEYREKYKNFIRRQVEAEGRKPVKSEPFLPEALPVLLDVWADADGNILACRKTECLEDCTLEIRAYSPQGEFLADFTIDSDDAVLAADHRFRRIVLTGRGFYGLVELRNDPDRYLHLARSVFPPR